DVRASTPALRQGDARVPRRADENHQSPGSGGLNRALGSDGTGYRHLRPEEAVMFIGELEETGVIEPVIEPGVSPQVLADEPPPSTTEIEDPVPEPAAT